MAEQAELHVTETGLQSLADKLEGFSKGLSPAERAALAALIRLATAAASVIEQPEVSGHLYDPIAAGLLAEAHQRELLAEDEKARMIAQARAAHHNDESVWDGLRQHVDELALRDLGLPRHPTTESTTRP